MLINKIRPLVQFDPTNKQHRSIYYEFERTRSWSHSPYRFYINDPIANNNLAYSIPKLIANHISPAVEYQFLE